MSVKKTALVWFKTNLRLRDNECLFKALAENDLVISFYCLDDQLFSTSHYGFQKAGTFRLKFLKESLRQLDKDLQNAGSRLVLLNGIPENEIYRLAKEHGVQMIYAEKEVAPEELNTQKKVVDELLKLNCTFTTFECRNLLHSSDLPFPISGLPEVFTDFRKRVEGAFSVRPVLPVPSNIRSTLTPLPDWSLFDKHMTIDSAFDPRAALPFKGGSEAAHQRLNYYFHETKAVSSYKVLRNGMVGEGYSSKFSPWLALGCISAREIYESIKHYEDYYGANESTYWLVFELLWRDYFGFCMEKNAKRYFSRSNKQPSTNGLSQWIEGTTGQSFIDANMIELKQTGFMSNRGRQNVASYLCNDLNVDWRYGAAYFEQQLIDYDVCNNWGNWAYLAGVGNDPRANRYFNIDKQAAAYDPDGVFQCLWLNTP